MLPILERVLSLDQSIDNHSALFFIVYNILIIRFITIQPLGLQNYSFMTDNLAQSNNNVIINQEEEMVKPEKVEMKQEDTRDVEISQEQLNAKSNYLSRLLEKHVQKATLAHSFTQDRYRYFQEQILNGKYEIKSKHWSAQQQKQKQNKAANNKNTSSKIFQTKKQLEEQLEHIQNKLNQNQEQKSNKQLSQEQRIAFSKKIQKEKKQNLKRKQELIKKQEQERLQGQKRLKEETQRVQNQRRSKRKLQLEQKMKVQEETRKKKEQQFKSQQIMLKEKMKQKTMIQKMEEQYNVKQNQSLEERKKHLAQIRALHKPIDRKQLDAHAEKFEQFHLQRLAAIAAEAEKQSQKPVTAFYKSVFYKKIKEQPKYFVDKQNQEQMGKLREARDKLKRFSEQVRQNYKPSIDEKKKQELQLRNSSMKNRSMSSNIQRSKDPKQGKKLGLRYLEFSKMQIDQKLLGSGDIKSEEQTDDHKKLDYLSEMRQKNKNRKPQNAHSFMSRVQKLNIPKQDKMRKILQFTENLQKRAKQKEQIDVSGTGYVDSELDRLYLQAIEAKLGLLQDY